MNIGVKAYPKKRKGGSTMNQFIQFVSALAVSIQQGLLRVGLVIKGLLINTKNAIKLLYQVQQYLVFF
uniref:hypothetical protein n=1 Tax=Lactococcus lactis TaxID=1358 RepID=UPI00155D942E|nr:hypothetical protein [Lactococcus lactis]